MYDWGTGTNGQDTFHLAIFRLQVPTPQLEEPHQCSFKYWTKVPWSGTQGLVGVCVPIGRLVCVLGCVNFVGG